MILLIWRGGGVLHYVPLEYNQSISIRTYLYRRI